MAVLQFIFDWAISTAVGVFWSQIPSFVYSKDCHDQCWPFVGVLTLYCVLALFLYPLLAHVVSRFVKSETNEVHAGVRTLFVSSCSYCLSIAFSTLLYYLIVQVDNDVARFARPNYIDVEPALPSNATNPFIPPPPPPPPHYANTTIISNNTIFFSGNLTALPSPLPPPPQPFAPDSQFDRHRRRPKPIGGHTVPSGDPFRTTAAVVSMDLLIALFVTAIAVEVTSFSRRQLLEYSPADPPTYGYRFYEILSLAFDLSIGYAWDHLFSMLFFRQLEANEGSSSTTLMVLRFVRSGLWMFIFSIVALRIQRTIPTPLADSPIRSICAKELSIQGIFAMISSSITLSVYDFCFYWLTERTSSLTAILVFSAYSVWLLLLSIVLIRLKWIDEESGQLRKWFWFVEMGWLVSYGTWYSIAYALDLLPSTSNPLVLSAFILVSCAITWLMSWLFIAMRRVSTHNSLRQMLIPRSTDHRLDRGD